MKRLIQISLLIFLLLVIGNAVLRYRFGISLWSKWTYGITLPSPIKRMAWGRNGTETEITDPEVKKKIIECLRTAKRARGPGGTVLSKYLVMESDTQKLEIVLWPSGPGLIMWSLVDDQYYESDDLYTIVERAFPKSSSLPAPPAPM